MLPKLPGLNPDTHGSCQSQLGHGCSLVTARYGCASARCAATVAFDGARQCRSRRVNGFGITTAETPRGPLGMILALPNNLKLHAFNLGETLNDN